MDDTPVNPYEPSAAIAAEPAARVEKTAALSNGSVGRAWAVTAGVSAVGFGKWFLPALVGTGEIYTMGIWLEEWVVVLLAGLLVAIFNVRLSWLQPLNYFTCAYICHLPLFIGNEFVLLILFIGAISTGLMYVGIAVGDSLLWVAKLLRR